MPTGMTAGVAELESPSFGEPAGHASFDLRQVGVVVPTLNAEKWWPEFQAGIDMQGLRRDQVLVIDSSSTDRTVALARAAGYQVLSINSRDFGHGSTRRLACEMLRNHTAMVFLTQDAVLATPQSIEVLCSTLLDPEVGAAYGRQLPRSDANPIEAYARLFNYPAQSEVRTLETRASLGIKTAFLSNSFAVYRVEALNHVGGFPAEVILAEDSVVAARMLMRGWKVIYHSDATVIHSHDISLRREFRRYFDTGVHHAREKWLLETFGHADGEGLRFIKSEFEFLRKTSPKHVPLAFARNANKLAAYKLGLREGSLPMWLKRRLTGYPNFWRDPNKVGSATPAGDRSRVARGVSGSGSQSKPDAQYDHKPNAGLL